MPPTSPNNGLSAHVRRVASPPTTDPQTRAEALSVAARALRSAEHVCVLTGAGTSAESGIPTFRDALTGHWAKFTPQELATPEAFAANPQRVWQWYAARRALVRSAQPNPGHLALASLAMRVSHCTLVTQNVDDLHQRAGSRDIVSLHGSIMRARCSAGCAGTIEPRDDQADAPPTCEQCGALMRPDVVWFGEPLPMDQYEIARNAAVACDVFLSVGTSNVVEPAASLPWVAAAHGATVIVVNPTMEGQRRGPSVLAVEGPSGVLLPRLIAEAYAGKRPRRVDPSSHAGRPPAIVEPMADEVQASSEVAAEASDEGQRDVGVAQHRAAQDLTTRDEGPPAPSY
ncbi:MAG: NAD-dependent protein deacylase [Gemmatimonadaceae bacterium]|nr:NAD-dependent protein deacylase [Gemmatimonadaceae bacterium]MCC6432921.1 NAD-dependent protein deacylase [Gemmatimonadaceae bacterium]